MSTPFTREDVAKFLAISEAAGFRDSATYVGVIVKLENLLERMDEAAPPRPRARPVVSNDPRIRRVTSGWTPSTESTPSQRIYRYVVPGGQSYDSYEEAWRSFPPSAARPQRSRNIDL